MCSNQLPMPTVIHNTILRKYSIVHISEHDFCLSETHHVNMDITYGLLSHVLNCQVYYFSGLIQTNIICKSKNTCAQILLEKNSFLPYHIIFSINLRRTVSCSYRFSIVVIFHPVHIHGVPKKCE